MGKDKEAWKPIGMRIPVDLKERLDIVAAQRRIAIQEITRDALERYLSDGESPESRVPAKLRVYVDRVIEVLAHGPDSVTDGLTANIDLFLELRRLRAEQAPRTSRPPRKRKPA